MPKVVVLGSSNTDLVLRVDRLPALGQTVLGESFAVEAGGKGANQAVAAARMGAQVTFVGAIGDDAFGEQALRHLAAEGIDVADVMRLPDTSSGVALIFVDRNGGNLIGVGSGANAGLAFDWIVERSSRWFSGPGVFVTQLETPLACSHEGLARARRAGWNTVLNPAPVDQSVANRDWMELVDVLVVNEHEATLAGSPPPPPDRRIGDDWRCWFDDVIDSLRGVGATKVVVTLGELGQVVATEAAAPQWFPAYEVVAQDTVAAGDTFVGALACRLAEGAELVAACQFAARAAAIAVTRPGAQAAIPHRRQVDVFTAPTRSGTGPAGLPGAGS